ncbi:MAG: arginine--tRNA ligase domain-containing protein, partial [Candidatus Amoebophilus sp.]
MFLLDRAKQHIFEAIIAIAGNDSLVNDVIIDYPPVVNQGDLCLACFILAKNQQQSPVKFASDLADKFKPDDIIAQVQAVGPYVNFWLQPIYLQQVITEALTENYGQNQTGAEERIMIEYSNANTHKEYHIGHLRNICYGDAVAGLLT